jgi:hypothetical protein
VLEALPARVDLAVDEHPVEPALEHGRRQVPPHRVLQDQQVRLLQPGDLGGDIGRQLGRLRSVPLLGLHVEP